MEERNERNNIITITFSQEELAQIICSILYAMIIKQKQRGIATSFRILEEDTIIRLLNLYRQRFGIDDFYQSIDKLMQDHEIGI